MLPKILRFLITDVQKTKAEDDDATIDLDGDNVFKLPQLFNSHNTIQSGWIVEDGLFSKKYIKNSNIMVNNVIYKTDTVQIY